MKAIMFRFPRAGREGDIPAAPIRWLNGAA